MTDFPETLLEQFSGDALCDKTALSAALSTVDADGWPHLSFLSAGEVLAQGGRIALTLWGDAHSTRALERQRRGVLFAAGDGIVHEARLEVVDIQRPAGVRTAIVLARLDALREHSAPYATVRALIDFRLDDPAAATTRWEGQVATMREALARLPDPAAT